MPFEYEDKSKFDYEDSSSTEEAKDFWKKAPKWVKAPVAGGEAVLSMLGGIPSQIVGGLAGLSKAIATGSVEKGANLSEEIQQKNFGFGQYRGSTELGKEYTENLGKAFAAPGEFAGDVGAAIGKQVGQEDLGRLTLQLPTDTFMNFLPLHAVVGGAKGAAGKTAKALEPKTKVSPRLEYLDEASASAELPVNDPLFRAKMNAADEAQVARLEAALDRRNPSQAPMIADASGNVEKLSPNQIDNIQAFNAERATFERQQAAQAALEARQKTLEGDVARQTSLDMNAAERARQGAAPTGYEQWVEQKRQSANVRQPSVNKAIDFEKLVPDAEKKYGGEVVTRQYPYDTTEAPFPNEGLDVSQFNAERMSQPLEKSIEEGQAWEQFRNEETSQAAIDEANYQKQQRAELELLPFEEQLRTYVRGPESTAQGPKTRAAKSMQMRGGLGSKQRGMLDVTDLSKAADKVKNYVNDLKKINLNTLAPKQPDDYARQIPGMGNALDAVIIKPKLDLDSALNSSKDIPDSFKPSVASGPSLTAEKYKNPVVKHVAGLLSWQDKKATLAQDRLVKPIERKLNSLDKPEQVTLADAMREEMFSNSRYTDEQLLAAGVSKKGLESYKELRSQLDAVYDLQARKLMDQGRKVPTKQEAHLASLRNGPWHVVIKGQDGKPWHIATESKYSANKAAKWIQENVGGENLKVEVDYRGSNNVKGIPQDIMGGYQDILRILDEEPSDASLVVKEAIRSAQERAGYEYQRQSDRFKRKNNFRGFEGDMPWLDNKENAARLLQAQVDYLNNAYNWSYMQDALTDIKDVMSNERFLKEQPIAAEYLKDIVNLQTGQGTHALKAAEDWIGKKLGFSGAGVRTAFAKANSATSLMLLGGSPGYILQAPLSALHALSLHIKEGSMSPKAALLGMEDGLASVISDMGHTLGSKGNLPMTELGQAAKKYGEENGVWSKHMFGDLDKLTQNQMFNSNIVEPLYTTIQTPEKLQRSLTFFGFVHGLESTGKYKNMYDLFQRAEELTDLAATNFRRHEIPLAVQETGVVGQMLFKFKAPTLNYFHQLHMNLRDMKSTNKETRTKAALAFGALLGTTAFLGGMESLPGVQEMDGGLELAKTAMSNVSPEAYSKMRDVSVKEFIRENFGMAAARGAVEWATGASMQSRFGTDTIDLENPLGSMPVVSTAENVGKSAMDLAKGNAQQAAWRLLPPMARGNLEVSSDAFQTIGGQRRPSDIGDPAVALNRSEADKKYRRFGLRSSQEALQLENNYRSQQQLKRDETASKELVKGIVDNIIVGNEEKLAKDIITWMEINPGQDISSQLAKKIYDASVTPDVKQLMAAKSLRALERAMKARQFATR